MITLKKYNSRAEADLAKALLEENEIPCYVLYHDLGGFDSSSFGGIFSLATLMIINESDRNFALELLNQDKNRYN